MRTCGPHFLTWPFGGVFLHTRNPSIFKQCIILKSKLSRNTCVSAGNLRRKGIWCNLDAKGERIFLVKWMPMESFVGFLGPLKVTNRLFQVQYFYVAKFGGPQLPAVEAPNPQSATSWGVGLPVTLEASSHIRIKGFREKSWWYVGRPLNFQTPPPNGRCVFPLDGRMILSSSIRFEKSMCQLKRRLHCTIKLNIGWTLAWFDVSETEPGGYTLYIM